MWKITWPLLQGLLRFLVVASPIDHSPDNTMIIKCSTGGRDKYENFDISDPTLFTLKLALCNGVSPEECRKVFGLAPALTSSLATPLKVKCFSGNESFLG